MIRLFAFFLAAAITTMPAVAQISTQIAAPGGCPPMIARWWQQIGGRIHCNADPTRPAILLVHGLHQDLTSWTAPAQPFARQYRTHPSPQKVGSTQPRPGIGVFKVGISDLAYGSDAGSWNGKVNWYDYLVSRGYTVATWTQAGPSFAPAAQSALVVFDSLLSHTRQRSSANPPPIALIGHSRGGLVIRHVLKRRADNARVKWVFTLHSPHQGSALGNSPARIAAEAVDLFDCCSPADLTSELKQQAKDLVAAALRQVSRFIGDEATRELAPDAPLIRSLREAEQPLPGVQYYTFGGTNPNFFNIYSWLFDGQSALPLTGSTGVYYVWNVSPLEIAPVSPMMSKLRDFTDEVKPGMGDGLVSNASARLPFSTHFTTDLNHVEVLYNRQLQDQVLRLLQSGN